MRPSRQTDRIDTEPIAEPNSKCSVIGGAFQATGKTWAAVLTALVTVGGDFLLSIGHVALQVRAPPVFAAMGLLLWLAAGDRHSLGLRLRPSQGWRWWIAASAMIGGGILAISLAYFLIVPSAWAEVGFFGRDIRDTGVWAHLVLCCVEAPLLEESVYRVVLCSALIRPLGRTPTILVSGFVFAALHFAYGNPGPDNLVAGFVLGWAYLKSGSVWVPILMHAGGNLAVLAIQLAAA